METRLLEAGVFFANDQLFGKHDANIGNALQNTHSDTESSDMGNSSSNETPTSPPGYTFTVNEKDTGI